MKLAPIYCVYVSILSDKKKQKQNNQIVKKNRASAPGAENSGFDTDLDQSNLFKIGTIYSFPA